MQKLEKNQSKYLDFAIELFFLALVFLAPTVFDRRIGIVFSGTKTAVIRLLVLSMLTIWSCKIIIFKEHKFIRTFMDWPVVSYMLVCTVATLSSVHVLVSFMGFYGRYEGLSTIYVWGLLYFIVTNFITTKEQFRRIFITVVSAGTMMSIYGIIQRWGKDPYAWGGVITWQRVIATIGQPNFLAAYVIMAFFFGLAMLVMDKNEDNKAVDEDSNLIETISEQAYALSPFLGFIVAFLIMIYSINTTNFFLLVISWLIITVLALMFTFTSKALRSFTLDSLLVLVCLPLIYTCILFTQSRGGLFAFFGAGVLFVLLVNRRNIIFKWKKLVALGFIIFSITAITFASPQFSPIARLADEVTVEGAESKSDKIIINLDDDEKKIGLKLKGAAGSRIETWKSALNLIADYPFFGIGPEVLKMIFPKYETELFRFKEAFHVKQDRCHNEVCDVAVTKGMVSLFVYLWLLFMFYKLGLSKLKSSNDNDFKIYIAAILVAATSYFIQNEFSFGVVAISTLLWVMFGLIAVPDIKSDEELVLPELKGISAANIPWLYIAIVFVVFFLLSFYSVIQYRADKLYKDGKNDVQRGMFENALTNFRKSLEISPYESGTLTYYGITHLNVAQNNQDKKDSFERSIIILKRASLADPYNADNFYIIGKTYISMQSMGYGAALELSMENTNKALLIDPFYAEAYHNRGVVYEARGELELAVKNYEKAFMVNPNLGISMQRLGHIFSNAGKPEIAVEIFKRGVERYPNSMPLLENLGISYSLIKREDLAAEAFKEIVELDPKNLQAKINLGLSYIRANNFNQAKAQFLESLILDPSNITVHNNLGLIYYKEGKVSDAIAEFKQVLMLDSNNEYAKQMLGNLGVK